MRRVSGFGGHRALPRAGIRRRIRPLAFLYHNRRQSQARVPRSLLARAPSAAMFLFTTPPAREPAPVNPVVDAIRQGAERTGTGFDYLLATAQRESALDPEGAGRRPRRRPGCSSSSSRPGSGSCKQRGAEARARRLCQRHRGPAPTARSCVDDPRRRRRDPRAAATTRRSRRVMAGAFTQQQPRRPGRRARARADGRRSLRGAFPRRARRRRPDPAAQSAARRSAAARVPRCRGGEPPDLLRPQGPRPRRRRSLRAPGGEPRHARRSERRAAPSPRTSRSPSPASDGPALHGLFQTDGRAGRSRRRSPACGGPGNAATPARRVAATRAVLSALDAAARARPSRPSPRRRPPPRRPRMSRCRRAAPASLPAVRSRARIAAPADRLGAIGRPLDLLAFMSWRRRA